MYVNPHTHDIVLQSTLDRTHAVKEMTFVGALASHCNDYNRYCLRTYQKWNTASVEKTPDVTVQVTPSDQADEKTVIDQITPSIQSDERLDVQTDK